ncbi:hypothetical protein LFL96_00105 [Paraburkholderia sp. D15]|uniref:hypothetical protein n=1 Tax=Paraburkholderia sp. D15 TaxID=2880218 RepID=UPI00247ACA59|nr:hypothetical protein [Paraburkholderia sp. D15]WGS49955.1 hypothetical protein LFL96_00105 [Paraburkholderia sp. D15]
MKIRLASSADNPAILGFCEHHAMQGALPLRFDRSPDYFALHRCHADDHRTWLAEDALGDVKGIASLVVRDGYLHDRVQRVAYLGDLRIVPDRRLSRSWMDEVRGRLADLERDAGVQHAYCCMIRDNKLAAQSLLGTRRHGRLPLTHWRGYGNVSIHGRKGWQGFNALHDRDDDITSRPARPIRVVRAQSHHADALRAFLDAESKAQPFGPVFDEREFERRLSTWTDFGIESFLLALDARGNLVGCVAPWDAGRIKRIVLEKLPLSLQAIRVAFNAFAPMFGRPRIAPPGEALLDVYLTHLQVKQRDPEIFAALLDAAWSTLRNRYALVQLCLYDDDPLWPALARYRLTRVPMDLYTLSSERAGAAIDSASAARIPGFEIYLV